MANEIDVASFADLLTSEVLTGMVELLYADRGALPNHPALIELPNLQGRGSTTHKISGVGLGGYDLPSASAEDATISNTALTDDSAQLVIAHYGKAYTASGTWPRWSTAPGPSPLSRSRPTRCSPRCRTCCTRSPSWWTTSPGSAAPRAWTSSLSVILDQITALEVAKVQGPYLGILHPQAWGDVRSDIALNSGGAVQWHGDSQSMLSIMSGLGWQGRYFGVDFMTTTHVLDDSTDVWGGIMGRGSLVYGWANPSGLDLTADQVVLGDKVLFERSRAALDDETTYVMHMYSGAVEYRDAGGRTIKSDLPLVPDPYGAHT
jgi:hypothetical protein